MTHTAEQFDYAVSEGIKLFMRKGFVNVSIDDIVSATGLNRYAIYSAFGTKADFFRACVRRYCAAAVDSVERLTNDASIAPKEAARANLYAAAKEMCEVRAGCLVCENMTEMRQYMPELEAYCREYYATKEKILAKFFARALRSGAIPPEIEPDQGAAAFMIFKFGLSNEVKRTPDFELLKGKIDAFISAMFRS